MFKTLYFLIETFLLRVFFKKEEYDIKSKEFNVFKILLFTVMVTLSSASIYFIYKLIHLYNYINTNCKSCLEKVS